MKQEVHLKLLGKGHQHETYSMDIKGTMDQAGISGGVKCETELADEVFSETVDYLTYSELIKFSDEKN